MTDTRARVDLTRQVAAVLASTIGASVVIGGWFDWDVLRWWTPALPAAKPVVGVVFLLLGLTAFRSATSSLGRSATGLALTVSAVVIGYRLTGRPIEVGGLETTEGSLRGVPTIPTAVGLLFASTSGVLRALGRRSGSQILAVGSFSVGGFALLSVLYGDRTGTVLLSQFPGTAMSVPAATGLIAVSVALLLGTPDHGVVGWFTTDRLGVRTVRRVLPAAIAVPILVAGFASWLDLNDRLGEPRAFAAIAAVMTVAILAVAVRAALVIDEMALVAESARHAEERLAVAVRSAQLADLARALAVAGTVDEVCDVVRESASLVLGASSAHIDFEPADADVEVPLTGRGGEYLGALRLSWDRAIDLDEEAASTLSTVGGLVSQSLERARLSDTVAADARRNGELARLAEMLAGAATTDDVLSFLAEHVTGPVGASLGVIGLIDAELKVLHRHFPPSFRPRAVALGSVSLDQKLPLVVSAMTGRSIIVRNRTEMLEEFPDAIAAFDAGEFSATAQLPFRDQHGKLFGSLGLAWRGEVAFDDSMFGLLSTVADLAAQTLERAWLSDEQNRAGERSSALARLAEALASSATLDDVELAVATHVPSVLASSAARLKILEESTDADPGAVPSEDPDADEVHEPNDQIPPDVDPDEIEFGIGEPPESNRWAQIIVRSRAGSSIATVFAEWPDRLPPESSLRSAFSTVGDVVGQTLERVALADAEHRLVGGLQRRALRPLPSVEGLEVAAHYEPASQYLGMGGDWYEGVLHAPHSLGLVVGDVVGHGTDAAIDMLQLSSILSSLVALGIPLEHLFDSAQEAVGLTPIYATAWVGTIDPIERTLHYVSAGHPPAILMRPGRRSILLDGGRQPMLGVRSTVRRSGAAQVPSGATIVVYTDGLVERRGETIDVGFDRLMSRCDEAGTASPQELLDRLVEQATQDHSVDDDIAVVVVRVAGA